MEAVFLQVLNMSLTASYVVLFVLAARLLLKKAPKRFSYALWSVVLFRLICPFSFEGLFSLLLINPEPIPGNITYVEVPQINTGINLVDNAANPILAAQTATPGVSVFPMQIWISIGEWIWGAGIAVLLIYSVVSLLRLRSKLVGAVKCRHNIYLADHIASPFVMGLLRPKIYLPSTLSEREREYIVLHEQTHVRRLDHIVKIVAFLALTVHWFNPLVWAAFFLCVKDMEMSCDEAVMKRMDTDIRREYSASLLSLATGRKIVAGIPLAFGEGDTKGRIRNVMNYKKPAFWIIAVAVIAVVAVVIGLAANPRKNAESIIKNEMADILRDNPGEFSIDGIQQAGDYTLAVVNCKPGMGQGSIYLYIFGKESGKLTVIGRMANAPPISLGVAVYKKTLPDITVLYGAVSDQVWLNPDDAPQKVDFTEVKALYSGGLARYVKVSNGHAFMICIDGDVYIEDVQFLSGNEVVSRLSELPISEHVIENFNSSSAAGRAQAVLDSVVSGGTVAMTLTTTDDVGGGRYEVPLEYGNGRNRVHNFGSSFDWAYVEGGPFPMPLSHVLKVESPDGGAALQCWQGSHLVLCTLDGESFWLSAGALGSDAVFDGTIFTYLRFWYDEAEISGLRGDILIPDKGQSYQEIAQAWTDAYEGPMLRATSGSKYACTYVKTAASVREDSMDSWYPAKALETEHFYFDYSTVFVPENERATNWLMAGNTVEYTGNDAPTGALKYYLMGPMYLTEKDWRCDGVGTGP